MDFSCFAFLAAVVVLGLDKLEDFEVFDVVADSPVGEGVGVFVLAVFLVLLVDFSGGEWGLFFL